MAPGRVDDDLDAPVRRGGGNVTRGDLQHLFGDRILLERVAQAGGRAPLTVVDTLDRTRVQFSPTTEQEWAHVTDRERLIAVDRRAIDEGTASGCSNTVDAPDYAVLFELDSLRASGASRPLASRRVYDALMIDEAQELAPLELALLGRHLKTDGTLIVAGDDHQQTDATSTFLGWPDQMRELGRPDHETVTLGIGYRCAGDVVRLARTILDPTVAAATEPATRVHSFDDELSVGDWLADGLWHLRRHDRRASVAILCRAPLLARRIVAMLNARESPARLVFDGRFLPQGVQVSTVEEAKGLEFDFVVVPDAGAREYPESGAARRMLYVAVTRARHQVALACIGERTPLVPRSKREMATVSARPR